jgi:membrane protease YdiL (CAAX protease family)
MSTAQLVTSSQSSAPSGLSAWFKRHPVLGYSLLAYGLSWSILVPLGLASLFNLPMPSPFVMVILDNLAPYGPTLAALIATALIGGQAGVGALLRRLVQWRVGLHWYLLVLFGPPLVTLAGASVWLGGRTVEALMDGWPMIFTRYLPYALTIVLIVTPLGEEPGWRGFALPRLQQRYGGLWGTVILGIVWSAWHLPNTLFGGYTALGFSLFMLSTFATAFIYTWVYNHTHGSLLLMLLLHSALNTNSNLIIRLLPAFDRPGSTELFAVLALTYGVIAVFIVVMTRGTLGYQSNAEMQ